MLALCGGERLGELGAEFWNGSRNISAYIAHFFPWFDADLQETTGLVIGASRATGQPVLIDPFDDRRYANANVGIFGHSGAGKTYLLSTLTLSALSLGAQVFVIDPEHEYGGLARLSGGVDVQLALGSSHSINVLDLRGKARDESTVGPAVADAVDLCAVICGAIDETERAQLEVAVRRTFETVETPVLGDVAARLPETSRVGRVLARWVQYDGSLVFATQNPGDLLSGDAGAVVATNPALHFFGAQRPGEAGKLQQAFRLSEAQRAGLETARRGEFLLAAGNQRLPIRVHAPPWQSAAIDLARPPSNLG